METAAADPDRLRSLRDRLAALGFPGPDDLPDALVEAVAGAWEDRARLEWMGLHASGAGYDSTHSRWGVLGLPPIGWHERRDLRDAIDAARGRVIGPEP